MGRSPELNPVREKIAEVVNAIVSAKSVRDGKSVAERVRRLTKLLAHNPREIDVLAKIQKNGEI